jgi:hypothetical protein
MVVINPSIRFEWIRKNWLEEEQHQANRIILDKVCLLFAILLILTNHQKAPVIRGSQY